MRLLISFLFVFLVFKAEGQSLATVYDLDFRQLDDCNWDWLYVSRNCEFVSADRGVTVRHRGDAFSSQDEMYFALRKHIIIPNTPYDSLTISLTFNNRTDSVFSFSVIGVGADEELVFRDKRLIDGDLGTVTVPIIVSEPGVSALNLYLEFSGSNSPAQVVELKEIAIYTDGRGFSEILWALDRDDLPYLDTAYIAPLSGGALVDLRKVLPEIDRTKVIGLGESAHGSRSIADMQTEFIKDLVLHHQCRVILLEVPFDHGLLFDLYAQGITSDLHLIKGYLQQTVSGGSSVLELLEWLKEHNLAVTNKVHIAGMDNNLSGPSYALMDFYTVLLGTEKVDEILYNLYVQNISHVRDMSKNNRYLQSKLGNDVFEYLIYALSGPFGETEHDFRLFRDSSMYERTSYWEERVLNAQEKIVVVAHSRHLQKLPLLSWDELVKPLGYFLNENYGDGYYTIDFSIGGGQFVQDSCRTVISHVDTMSPPPANSFSSAALRTAHDIFLYPTSRIGSEYTTNGYVSRYSQNRNYYEYASLKGRFDSVLFIRNSEASADFQANKLVYQIKFAREKRQKYIDIYRRAQNQFKGDRTYD